MMNSAFLRDFTGTGGAPPTARQLHNAFRLLLYDFGYDEEREDAFYRLADFIERWGALSPDRLLAITRRFAPDQPRSDVDEAGGDDVAYFGPYTSEEADVRFALAILAMLRLPEVPNVLLPYLASPYAMERWLAALGLVIRHDERVLPSLERMLVEFVGPDQPRTPQSGSPDNFVLWRHRLLRLLADWGDPRVVPPIRTGLIATLHAEEIEVLEPQGPAQEFVGHGERYTGAEAWRAFHGKRMEWVDEEHRFVYTLGQLGAFGALEGVPTRRGIYYWRPSWTDDSQGDLGYERRVAESHAEGFRGNIWRVHLCFGALESRFRSQVRTIFHFSDAPELAEAVDRLLAGKFGMDETARRQAMEDYDQTDYVYATLLDYHRFAERAQEDAKGDDEMETQA